MQRHLSRILVIAAAAIAALAFALGNAGAELLDNRPITVVIPFTPGASSDTFQRLVAKRVTEDTGQNVIVESRPGGGGTVAAVAVKRALPDGHTLFQANSGANAANVALFPSLPYDPVKDFAPITLMWSFPSLLVVPANSPAKSVADLAAYAKAKPGGLSYGSQGNGSSGHLLGAMFARQVGVPMVHVPYRGAGPAALDVATGRIDFLFVSYASVLPHVLSGKVRVLAVTSRKRLTALPQIITMAEAGYPDFEMETWFGLVAPAGTPAPVIAKLNAAFVRAVRTPEVVKQMIDQGAEPATDTPQEFAAYIDAEIKRLGTIVTTLGIKGE
ncbi:MAG TPA: tripartite tricarboxylate transporter substrate binding protein [Xanthobacteraceae bacterium]|nr:tripartite tricarboxylate transporter substrate binding protein [Xanthobacteraceae bacterium]